jgi:hypothetical protein
MGYFTHNPEAYDEIVRRGVANYMGAHMRDDDFIDQLTEALGELQLAAESHHVFDELMKLAQKDIENAERGFWGDMVDAAMARRQA